MPRNFSLIYWQNIFIFPCWKNFLFLQQRILSYSKKKRKERKNLLATKKIYILSLFHAKILGIKSISVSGSPVKNCIYEC